MRREPTAPFPDCFILMVLHLWYWQLRRKASGKINVIVSHSVKNLVETKAVNMCY